MLYLGDEVSRATEIEEVLDPEEFKRRKDVSHIKAVLTLSALEKMAEEEKLIGMLESESIQPEDL